MSVTAAKGFRAGGIAAGIKPDGQLDVALVMADRAVPAAAVFTRNGAPAAPVQVSRRHLGEDLGVRAVILNSGCANAGTGEPGLVAASETAKAVATEIGCLPEEVLVCSTGPIGDVLEVGLITGALPDLVGQTLASAAHGTAAATAILTTDTVPKEATFWGDGFVVGGMAKGAGMIRPDMATMLAVLTTDAAADRDTLQRILRRAVETTFNCLNVDGCESTNDTVILAASGEVGGVDPEALAEGVEAVCRDLARAIAADAEGATRVVTVRIRGAADAAAARLLGRAVADSALVRSSFYGPDPNWGRILAALGSARVPFDPEAVTVSYAGTVVARDGMTVPDLDVDAVVDAMAGDFTVDVVVGTGLGEAEILTTDLTPEYVTFNGGRS